MFHSRVRTQLSQAALAFFSSVIFSLYPQTAVGTTIQPEDFNLEGSSVGVLNYTGFSNLRAANETGEFNDDLFFDSHLAALFGRTFNSTSELIAAEYNLGAGAYELSFDLGEAATDDSHNSIESFRTFFEKLKP